MKKRVEQLPEVGQPIVGRAAYLDQVKAKIEADQRHLDQLIQEFHGELLEHWTAAELNAVGIFIGTKPVL